MLEDTIRVFRRIKGQKVKWPNKKVHKDMVFNATFNKISVISWQSVLLVEKSGVPGEMF